MIGNNVSCGKKNEGLSWDAGDRRTQALIMINEELREFSDQIDEAHVCFLPFVAKRIAEKIICFLSNAVLRRVIKAKIHKLIVCF